MSQSVLYKEVPLYSALSDIYGREDSTLLPSI